MLSLFPSRVALRAPRPLMVGMTSRWFKVRASVKKMCDACYIVKRSGRVHVLCKRDAKVRIARRARERAPRVGGRARSRRR